MVLTFRLHITQPLRELLGMLEDRLVAMVVLEPVRTVARVLEQGILWLGMDWHTPVKPSGPRLGATKGLDN